MDKTTARASATTRLLDWIEHAGDPFLFFQQHRGRAQSPGVLLLAALLTDASVCLAPGALVDPETRADAAAWVKGEIESAPLCSFREACAILDLDEGGVRTHLLGGATRCLPRLVA